jgi:hypothetical protein
VHDAVANHLLLQALHVLLMEECMMLLLTICCYKVLHVLLLEEYMMLLLTICC